MAVPIEPGPELRVGKARPLFETGDAHGQYFLRPRFVTWRTPPYDIAAEGGSLLMATVEEPRSSPERSHLKLVTNWFEELKQRVPTGR